MFDYTEVLVFPALLVQERFYEDSVGQRHCAQAVPCGNIYNIIQLWARLFKLKKIEKLGF